jgi:4-amino-4-deoxy-L-arabinose transferase-like glycosyltransferase
MPIRLYYVLWALIAVVYLSNLSIDVMEVDAAQYASMAAEMKDNGSYLQVYHRGEDYLDKPPLLFWLSSLSFSVFGVNNVAYKLPALLALLIGLWATYRFTLLYDSRETARMAATILASTQAFFLMTNDVRTDGLLTGFVMFAVYQCAAYLKHRKWRYLVLAGIGVGLAMLAKGPIGAIIPVIAVAADLVMKGKWKDLINVKWLMVILVALLILAPMCYGLYTQFDLHPEKSVYGLQSPSGLKFFFWTQSFGRITGDIYWDNNAPPYFFLLTFLWDFMPWVIVFFVAFGYALSRIWHDRKGYAEYFCIGGFTIVLILLSFSKYKLPHYIFPLFPFAAILTARYLAKRFDKAGQALPIIQLVLMHVFYAAIAIVFLKAFPPENILLPAVVVAGFVSMWIAGMRFRNPSQRIVMTGCITAITFNIFLSLHLYPHLMQYQSGTWAGKMIREDRAHTKRQYFSYPQPSYSLDFYSGEYVPLLNASAFDQIIPGSWIYTTEEHIQEINASSPGSYKIIREFEHYHVSMLKLNFVLRESRSSALKKRFLIEKI